MSLAEPVISPADARAGRILDEVEARARCRGTRAIVMAELARDLGISTKTLYREFPSKDALLAALVDRWALRLAAAGDEREDELAPAERVRATVHRLVEFRSRFCDEFWDDLHADHPVAWARFVEMFEEVQRRSAAWMRRSVRPGVDAEFARALLRAGIEAALRPAVLATSGMTAHAAVDAAVDLWVNGALAPAPHSKSSP